MRALNEAVNKCYELKKTLSYFMANKENQKSE